MSELGCGRWEAFIAHRGGERIESVPFSDLSCSRVLGEMSDGRVTIPVSALSSDDPCVALLSELNPWQHELVLWRDGVESWVGPVLEPEFTESEIVIPARDLWQWFEVRYIEEDFAFVQEDLATIFLEYVTSALSRDLSPNTSVVTASTGILGDRSVASGNPPRAADQLRELSRSGLRFTVVGRRIYCGGTSIPTDSLGTLDGEMLQDPKLRPQGLSMATEFLLAGSATLPNEPILVRAGGFHETYGLVQRLDSEPKILDESSAQSSVNLRHATFGTPPYFFEARLDPTTPIGFDKLVPGAIGEVKRQVGPRFIDQTMTLERVSVRASVSDSGETEDVTVNFGP